jgi:CarD family transcriptional regulator
LCIEESETTLMAQKQKLKAAAAPTKTDTTKSAKSTKPVKVLKSAASESTLIKQTASKASAVKAPVGKAALPKSVKPTSAAKVAPAKSTPVNAKSDAVSQMKQASAKMASLKAAAESAARAKPPVKAAPAKSAAAPAQRAVPAAVGKPANQKITAPIPSAPPSAPVASPKALAEKAAAARGAMMAAPKKSVSARHGFKTNEYVVYPAHGVGRIVGIEEQEIAGMSLELFVITFDKEKLTLRVPTGKLASIGMRKLAEDSVVTRAMETLKGRARVKRTMWSRRAQEYVAKINSGDLISIAEVVRDLYRSEAQPEQSYSERQLYENALERMAREIAAVERLDERGAVQRIVEILSKSAKGRRIAAEEAEKPDSDDIKAA